MLEASGENLYAVGWAEKKPNLLYAIRVLHER